MGTGFVDLVVHAGFSCLAKACTEKSLSIFCLIQKILLPLNQFKGFTNFDRSLPPLSSDHFILKKLNFFFTGMYPLGLNTG
jgi:hypothetical protein